MTGFMYNPLSYLYGNLNVAFLTFGVLSLVVALWARWQHLPQVPRYCLVMAATLATSALAMYTLDNSVNAAIGPAIEHNNGNYPAGLYIIGTTIMWFAVIMLYLAAKDTWNAIKAHMLFGAVAHAGLFALFGIVICDAIWNLAFMAGNTSLLQVVVENTQTALEWTAVIALGLLVGMAILECIERRWAIARKSRIPDSLPLAVDTQTHTD